MDQIDSGVFGWVAKNVGWFEPVKLWDFEGKRCGVRNLDEFWVPYEMKAHRKEIECSFLVLLTCLTIYQVEPEAPIFISLTFY